MKFGLTDEPQIRFKQSLDVPLLYCKDVKAFAKPAVLSSRLVDLLYQEKTVNACKLRYLTVYAKDYSRLEWKTGRPRMTLQTVVGNKALILLEGKDPVELRPSTYSVIHYNNVNQRFILAPGEYNIIWMEYSKDLLMNYVEHAPMLKDWIDNYNGSKTIFYGTVPLQTSLLELQSELVNSPIESALRESWFALKMQQLLILVLEQQVKLAQAT